MRLDSPAARMTAASTHPSLGRGRARLCERNALVGQVGGLAAHGDQLRGNADGNLLRSERADLQPYRGVDTLEFLCGDTFLLERLVNREHLALAADHADIARLRAHGPGEHAHIVAMPARHDHQISGGVGPKLPKSVLVACMNFSRHWEALGVG